MLKKGYKPKNQLEIVGVLRHGVELKPWLGGEQLKLCRAITAWAQDQRKAYINEYQAFVPQMDQTFLQVMNSMIEGECTPEDFAQACRTLFFNYHQKSEFYIFEIKIDIDIYNLDFRYKNDIAFYWSH